MIFRVTSDGSKFCVEGSRFGFLWKTIRYWQHLFDRGETPGETLTHGTWGEPAEFNTLEAAAEFMAFCMGLKPAFTPKVNVVLTMQQVREQLNAKAATP